MRQRKRILYIVEAMGGGIFSYLVDLANRLASKNEIFIAYATRTQTPNDFKEYFDKSIKLIEVKNFTRSINFIKDTKALFEIKTIAKSIQPDIIHLHSSKAGVLGRIAFNGKEVPVFYTPHGYSFLMKDQSAIKRFIYHSIEAVFAKRKCTIIGCSEGENKESLKLTNSATFVNNGVNLSELDKYIEVIKGKENDKLTVFTLGRICYQKNPALFNEIALSMPEVDFIWIGDGELKNELTAPNIKITGWLKREKALECALGCQVFVLTSLWEGLPISLLEAMYMKKICIVSDVIGNHDVIKHKINGFICNNKYEFVKSISCCNDMNVITPLINEAYNEILSEYNTEIMAKKYDEIYTNSIT